MKKKFLILSSLAAITLALSSCGAIGMTGGVIFKGETQPVAVTSNDVGYKVGVAKCTNVLNLATFGNAGINEAAKKAGIKKISHVDVKKVSVLTLFCTETYYVYGE